MAGIACTGRAQHAGPDGSGGGAVRAPALGHAGRFLRRAPVVLREDQLHRALEPRARRTRARGEPLIELGGVYAKKRSELLAATLEILTLLEDAGTHLGPSRVHHGRPQSK